MRPIIDTLLSIKTNLVKEDRETAQENYSQSEMFQNLKNQRTISELDVSPSGTGLKANQSKNCSYPKKKSEKEERRFCLLGTINGPGYTTAKLWTCVYCIICKKTDNYYTLNDVRVENSFIKTRYFNWKHVRSTNEDFLKHEPSNCYQQAIQRLKEIPKSTEDIFL